MTPELGTQWTGGLQESGGGRGVNEEVLLLFLFLFLNFFLLPPFFFCAF